MSKRAKKTSRRKGTKKTVRPRPIVSSRKVTGWFLGLHHIRPSSRGGKNDSSNFYPKERWEPEYSEKHEAWHINFVNLTPEEVVDVIRSYTAGDGNISDQFFWMRPIVEHILVDGKKRGVVRLVKNKRGSPKRKRAWMFFFGNFNAHHAIKWIEQEFIKKRWLRPLP